MKSTSATSQFIIDLHILALRQSLKGNDIAAKNAFLELAKHSYCPAYIELGRIYEFEAKRNISCVNIAIDWYLKAIDAGRDREACIGLARIYFNTFNGVRDFEKCRYYLEKSINDYDGNPMGPYYGLGIL